MSGYQEYIQRLESDKGWLDVDLVHNCFLMGEEVGELFKAVRRFRRLHLAIDDAPITDAKTAVADELVDVFNFILAIANRLNIDLEAAFRDKNTRNQHRSWQRHGNTPPTELEEGA